MKFPLKESPKPANWKEGDTVPVEPYPVVIASGKWPEINEGDKGEIVGIYQGGFAVRTTAKFHVPGSTPTNEIQTRTYFYEESELR